MEQHGKFMNWNDAQRISQEVTEQRAKQVENFKEQNHELTDARDLQYWLDETGKDIDWLIDNANGLCPIIFNVLKAGESLDDIWHLEPSATTTQEEPTSINDVLDYIYYHYFCPIYPPKKALKIKDLYALFCAEWKQYTPHERINAKEYLQCTQVAYTTN